MPSNLWWISPVHDKSGVTTDPTPARQEDTQNQTEVFSDNEADVDFWKGHLIPDDSQLAKMYEAVRSYLPGVDASKFRPDYVGVRPKLVPPWGGFQDFVIRTDHAASFDSRRARRRDGGLMISLMGIESPGLTASLAIAEKVAEIIEAGNK